ncbi:hypothetical protein BTHE_1825 [Bifidobacterium thermophilum]|nr:hypothetical protein BTHE_1825 [Bifidobacterium thermophilum]
MVSPHSNESDGTISITILFSNNEVEEKSSALIMTGGWTH